MSALYFMRGNKQKIRLNLNITLFFFVSNVCFLENHSVCYFAMTKFRLFAIIFLWKTSRDIPEFQTFWI